MKESINILKNLNLNGKESNNDHDTWISPIELEKKIIQQERKKLILYLFLSNLSLLIFFQLSTSPEAVESIDSPSSGHSLIQINAQLHIPLNQKDKMEVLILTKSGRPLSKGNLLPFTKQQPKEDFGPWKIEVPIGNISNVLKKSNHILKIVPKTTQDYSSKEKIHEIVF